MLAAIILFGCEGSIGDPSNLGSQAGLESKAQALDDSGPDLIVEICGMVEVFRRRQNRCRWLHDCPGEWI